jgi:DNA polymerase-1
MEVFGVRRVGGDRRDAPASKTMNFGVIYGMGETALAKRLGIPRTEAAPSSSVLPRYVGVREFMDGAR